MKNKNALLGLGGIVVGALIMKKILFRKKQSSYATSVMGEQGVGLWVGATPEMFPEYIAKDPSWHGESRYALGKPDGLPALIDGRGGNYLALSLFVQPLFVEEVHFYLINIYSYPVTTLWDLDISPNGLDWINVVSGRPELEVGSHTISATINSPILAARLFQREDGVAVGLDAIEVIQ